LAFRGQILVIPGGLALTCGDVCGDLGDRDRDITTPFSVSKGEEEVWVTTYLPPGGDNKNLLT
jgi:hypothetical protein